MRPGGLDISGNAQRPVSGFQVSAAEGSFSCQVFYLIRAYFRQVADLEQGPVFFSGAYLAPEIFNLFLMKVFDELHEGKVSHIMF